MKQLISLLKSIMSQDMNLFRYKAKSNASKTKKQIFPVILALIFMYVIGTYLYIFADELAKLNLTYIMLTIAMIVPTIFTLIEGIYKSQGILFETKDNDLLFSLPIKKSKIILARLIKLYIFQYLYNLLFIIPAYAIYIYYENPGINFYLISIIMTFLLPILPTIIASFIGFIIKGISSKFKAKKIIQTVITMGIFLLVFYGSFNLNNFVTNLINNATNINEIISKIYYPIGAYIELIQEFNPLKLINLILINLLPLAIFMIIISKYYFKIISKSNEKSSNTYVKNIKLKERKPILSLIIKELKRYFSSTVYMINTLIGLVILFVATIAMSINLNGTIEMITEGEGFGVEINQILEIIPKIFFGLIIGTSCLSSITSSSISLEGKNFYILKSLPIKSSKILLAKVLTSNLIVIPIILISDIIFFISFRPELFDIISIILISIIMPTFVGILGLLINLKYPKMNATSDTEVVKQSMSSMIAVFGGMIIAAILIGFIIAMSSNLAIIIEIVVLSILTIILYKILLKYGERRFKEINN